VSTLREGGHATPRIGRIVHEKRIMPVAGVNTGNLGARCGVSMYVPVPGPDERTDQHHA